MDYKKLQPAENYEGLKNFQQLSVGINQLIEHSKTQNQNEQ